MTAKQVIARLIEGSPGEEGTAPGEDMVSELADVAAKPFILYAEISDFMLTRASYWDEFPDEHREIDAWRSLLARVGAEDPTSGAPEIVYRGHEAMCGELDIDDAWSFATVAFAVNRALKVEPDVYEAFKRLFYDMYGAPDRFKRRIEQRKGQNMQESSSGKFEQIGGDFGSAWDYGGTWYNAETGTLVHFPGIDQEERYEVDVDARVVDNKLKLDDYKRIANSLTLEDTQDAWEDVENEIRQSIADRLTAAKKFSYYRAVVDDDASIESDWAHEIAGLKEELELDDEQWAKLSAAHKEAAIADRVGWHEFDHYPDAVTKAELSAILGIEL